MTGPLFEWEMKRLARGGGTMRARWIFTLLILAVMLVMAIVEFQDLSLKTLFSLQFTAAEIDIQRSAEFGEKITTAFLWAQFIAICLITPAYAAGGFAEVKERRIFDFLRVTALSDRELILGPFFARMIFLLSLLLAGLPILLICLLYGGTEPKVILLFYLVTLTSTGLLASICLASSVRAHTFRMAMVRAYGMMLLFVFLGCGTVAVSPAFALGMIVYDMDSAFLPLLYSVFYPLFQVIISFYILAYLVKNAFSWNEILVGQTTLQLAREFKPQAIKSRPPLDENKPFVWKEVILIDRDQETSRGTYAEVLQLMSFVTAVFLMFSFGMLLIHFFSPTDFSQSYLLVFGGVGVFGMIGFTIVSACYRVQKEISANTWDLIRMIPADPYEVLSAKIDPTSWTSWLWGVPSVILSSCMIPESFNPILTATYLLFYFTAWRSLTWLALAISCRGVKPHRTTMIMMPLAAAIATSPNFVPVKMWPVFLALMAVLALLGWLSYRVCLRSLGPQDR